jgi:hypothetical protein
MTNTNKLGSNICLTRESLINLCTDIIRIPKSIDRDPEWIFFQTLVFNKDIPMVYMIKTERIIDMKLGDCPSSWFCI